MDKAVIEAARRRVAKAEVLHDCCEQHPGEGPQSVADKCRKDADEAWAAYDALIVKLTAEDARELLATLDSDRGTVSERLRKILESI